MKLNFYIVNKNGGLTFQRADIIKVTNEYIILDIDGGVVERNKDGYVLIPLDKKKWKANKNPYINHIFYTYHIPVTTFHKIFCPLDIEVAIHDSDLKTCNINLV